jgi:hypothetical protein
VPAADRAHLDDLAVDEFDPVVVFGEDTGLGHPVKLIRSKQFLCDVGKHLFFFPDIINQVRVMSQGMRESLLFVERGLMAAFFCNR